MKHINIILFICILIQFSCHAKHDIKVSDGFETSSLNEIWDTKKLIPGALEIQSAIVRSGSSAAKITLHAGDQIDKEKGTNIERVELTETRKIWAREDLYYEYAFSLFIPWNFPAVRERLVLAQWKQQCPVDDCNPKNPILAIRYIQNDLLITHKGVPTQQKTSSFERMKTS